MIKMQFMTTVRLTANLIVDIPNANISATVEKISDSMGRDKTKDFYKFCDDKQLSLSSQDGINQAIVEFAKSQDISLP